MRALLFFLSILILSSLSGVKAQSTSDVQIDTQSYALDGQTYILKNATLTWADITLEAGEVRFNLQTEKLTATQFVRFSDSRILAMVDRLELDLKTQTGTFYNVVLYDAVTQAYLTAEEAQKVDTLSFVATNCSVTTCAPQSPAWKITGEQVNYQGENFSSARGAVLLVSDIPVFFFPFLLWPTVTERQSGFLAPSYEVLSSTAEKFNLGSRLKIPYFWAVAPDQNLTLTTDFIQNRGLGVGVDYEYAFREGLRGRWYYWRIQENLKRDPTQESGQLAEEETAEALLDQPRFKFQFNHSQTFGERTRLLLSGQVFSDSQFQREYDRTINPDPNFAQDLNVNLSHQFELGNVNFLIDREWVYEEVALLNRNRIETRVQRLPEISFYLSGNPLAIPLTLELQGVATRFYRDVGIIGWREIFTPRLRYRFSPLHDFNVLLSYGRRLSYYQVSNPGKTVFYADQKVAVAAGERRDIDYEIGLLDAEVNTTLSRTIVPETGVFSRFKHLIQPRILFEAVEDVNQAPTRPIVLPTPRNPNPSPIAFFDNADALPGKRLLIVRLDNLLLAKKHLVERTLTLTERSMQRLESRLSDTIFENLSALKNQEFFSEAAFLDALQTLFAEQLTAEQERLIVSYTKRRIARRASRTAELSEESAGWVFSRLNIIQRLNLLREDKNYQPKGPQIEEQETPPGDPLLPLQIEWNLNPGPQFSVDFFLRYSYQVSRFVESKATFNVQVSQNNQAQISFHNNETSYRTPDDIFHGKINTLSFRNVFAARDDLSFGFSGKFNLNIPEDSVTQRHLIEDSFFINYYPRCYTIRLVFQELTEQTVTSGGQKKEITDPSIALSVSLGQVLPLRQQKFHF